MVTGIINCGICGFTINVEAYARNRRNVKLKIASDCPNYHKVLDELHEVDAFQEIFQKIHSGTVCRILSKYIPHPGCPGFTGILKVVEVAAGLALPQTVTIVISKVQT
jgi:hypothetical protein